MEIGIRILMSKFVDLSKSEEIYPDCERFHESLMNEILVENAYILDSIITKPGKFLSFGNKFCSRVKYFCFYLHAYII